MKQQYVVYCPEINEFFIMALDNITSVNLECFRDNNWTLDYIGEL